MWNLEKEIDGYIPAESRVWPLSRSAPKQLQENVSCMHKTWHSSRRMGQTQ